MVGASRILKAFIEVSSNPEMAQQSLAVGNNQGKRSVQLVVEVKNPGATGSVKATLELSP